MNDLEKKIPIDLTNLLNSINQDLSYKRELISLACFEVKISKSNIAHNGVKILYQVKDTDFLFEINYIFDSNQINCSYYPGSTNSISKQSVEWTSLAEAVSKGIISNHIKLWKSLLDQIFNLKNPLDFFKIDNFIEFYAGEFIQDFPISKEDEIKPFTALQQQKLLEFIDLQSKFIDLELSNPASVSSEKKQDLTNAQKIIFDIQENITRMTAAQVKRNMAFSLAAIRKWCEHQLINFLVTDKAYENQISRSLGSFVGGLLGIPPITG